MRKENTKYAKGKNSSLLIIAYNKYYFYENMIFIIKGAILPFTTNMEDKGIYYEMQGIVTSNDISQLDSRLHGLDTFSSLEYLILDYTNADAFVMSASEVIITAALAKAASISNPNLVIAAVSTDETLVKALQLYSSYKGGHPWKSSLHDNLEDARQWVRNHLGA